MEKNKKGSSLGQMFAGLTIVVCLIVGHLVFHLILGDGSNFEGGDNMNHPLPGNFLGIVYKGGFIVPILMSFFLIVLTVSFERYFTLNKANGKGSIENFVHDVRKKLSNGDIDAALKSCDKQQGSVANVVKSTLETYKEMAHASGLDKDQKIANIQKSTEETTSLELPMLEKNLSILSTLASVSTLVALLGTVLGMIRAFAAMAQAGAPDATALANGISEALINTAIGIGTSAIAIICYNFFTSKIDTLSYSIDEAGMSIAQTFSATQK
ncbi:MAG: MotA/TolQ/ExbB proton channel family protein [Cytophagales bacterium]|nr:MotA/TolQ/ExbB proton channel family protein [Cytophagales bacterium]